MFLTSFQGLECGKNLRFSLCVVCVSVREKGKFSLSAEVFWYVRLNPFAKEVSGGLPKGSSGGDKIPRWHRHLKNHQWYLYPCCRGGQPATQILLVPLRLVQLEQSNESLGKVLWDVGFLMVQARWKRRCLWTCYMWGWGPVPCGTCGPIGHLNLLLWVHYCPNFFFICRMLVQHCLHAGFEKVSEPYWMDVHSSFLQCSSWQSIHNFFFFCLELTLLWLLLLFLQPCWYTWCSIVSIFF